MEGLRDLEEIVSSRNYIPVGGNFEFSKQRNETIQHLSHSSTNRGGVDHLHCLPLDFAGKKAQFFEFGRADNCLVVIYLRLRDGSWGTLPCSRSVGPLGLMSIMYIGRDRQGNLMVLSTCGRPCSIMF